MMVLSTLRWSSLLFAHSIFNFIFARIVLLFFYLVFYLVFSLSFFFHVYRIHAGMQRSFCSHPRSSTTLRMSVQVNQEAQKEILLRIAQNFSNLHATIYECVYIYNVFPFHWDRSLARCVRERFVSFEIRMCTDLQLMIITFSIWFDLPLLPHRLHHSAVAVVFFLFNRLRKSNEKPIEIFCFGIFTIWP